VSWVFTRASDAGSTLNLQNTTAATYLIGTALFNLKECMKQAGWTVIACGTGSGGASYTDDVGPRITEAVIHGTNYCWWAIQAPTGGKVLVFQRGDYRQVWRVKTIYADGITGGDADTTPSAVSAAKEYVILGGGTDASPTFTDMGNNENDHVAHVACDNASPYSFYVASYRPGTLVTGMGPLLMDGVSDGASGDVDPCVYYMKGGYDAYNWRRNTTLTAWNVKAWAKNGSLTWTKWYSYSGFLVGYAGTMSSSGMPLNMGVNMWSTNDQYTPVLWGTPSYGGVSQYKGMSGVLKFTGTDRTCGSTRTITTTMDHIQIGEYLLPWDGATTPLV